MPIRHEYRFLGIPIWRSIKPLSAGETINLSAPIPTNKLDTLQDGTLLKNQVQVESSYALSVHKTTKGTEDIVTEEFSGDPYTLNSAESYYEDDINTANIMFARGVLATILGIKHKIIYQHP